MKIVLFISSISGGGAERVLCNLANYLVENDNEVTIITMSDIEDSYKVDDRIIRFYLLNKNERKNMIHDNLLRNKRLKDFLVKHKEIDCYLTMLPIPSFLIMRLKKYTRARVIYAERNNPTSYPLYKRLMMRFIGKKCDGLIVQTSQIGKWYNCSNKIIIPNAINREIVDNNSSNIKEEKIVSVGRLEAQKNYPMLIKAFEIFSRNNPNYILDIYGQGNLENELKKLTKKLKIDNKVNFNGFVNNVGEKISNAKMFVMTSNFEGMPNALIEAMCLGLPCISTDCDGGGVQELIKNNVNGIIIKKNDVDSLVKSMEKIVVNEEFANKLGRNSKKLKENLSFEKIYSQWIQFIKNTCE